MYLFRKNKKKLTDRELLQQFVETGNSEYFGELYDRYILLVYGICLRYLGQPEAAHDGVMQIFEDSFTKIRNFQVNEFRTWIYSVAKNYCLHQLRKTSREIPVDFNNDIMESEDVLYLLEEENEEDKLKALEYCMEKLPENQRLSIHYFFIENISYLDITVKTGFDMKRVKSYIQNGKRNLSICIRKRLG